MKKNFISYFSFYIVFSVNLSQLIILGNTLAYEQISQDNLTVLNPNSDQPQSEEMMRKYLRRLTHEALDRRLKTYEDLKTEKQISEYQQKMKQFFLQQLDLPEQRTPLNARIVGKKIYNNYRLEKIIYESQPGFFVTALFFLPLTPPPYPGALLVCGHETTGKAAYQQIGVMLARNGIAALCPDPIGQGERNQILDEQGQRLYRATTEHLITGVAPILIGRSIASYMIWDGIRGIDYLVSRPEIDSTRIGCTGNSGGGNMTSYLMALDERIVCAAPCCFMTTTRLKNESPGPGDAEQNIHAQTAYGMDLPDYIIMRSPKPTLILSATQDFVPIQGAWEAFRQAKRIYTKSGFAERIDLVEADAKHGFSTHLRVGAVRWMRRWLLNIDDAVTEKEYSPEPPEELQCTPDGQVLLIPGARSVFDLNGEKEQQLAEQRKKFLSQTDKEDILKKIRDITGIRKLEDLPRVEIDHRGSIQCKGYHIKKLVLRWETDIELPALLFQPDNQDNEYYLYVHSKGKHIDTGPEGPVEKLVQKGNTVLAVDLRGIGETRTTPWRYTKAIEFTGSDVAEFFIAYMLDKSFISMRAEDILVCARFLTNLVPIDKQQRIRIIATDQAGPPALHAMALEPVLFDSLTLIRSLISWTDVIHTPITKNVLVNVVHGALCTYDLPDLVSLIGSERIIIKEPSDAQARIK